MKKIVQIAIASAIYSIDKLYDYELEDEFICVAQIGSRVVVPFGRGNKAAYGFVLNMKEQSDQDRRLKKVLHVYSDFVLSERDITLANWMRTRYFCTFYECAVLLVPPGIWGKMGENTVGGMVKDKMIKVLRMAVTMEEAVGLIGAGKTAEKRQEVLDCFLDYEELPEKELLYLTGVSQDVVRTMCKKEILTVSLQQMYRRPVFKATELTKKILLSPQQEQVFADILQQSKAGAGVALLNGITGSGKTEVYIRLIEEVLKQNKTAMLLVPEIALTPQMVHRFYGYFKDKLAVMHSSLTTTQRYDEFQRAQRGEASIVIGTRSAVFAPLDNLGIIIIDEEQEYSYKSENPPRYSAIDIAKVKAAAHNALLVLGSATPSIEAYYQAKIGKYSLYELNNRYGQAQLPLVHIWDMRQMSKDGGFEIGQKLYEEIADNLQRKEQTILFVNRRGSNRLACIDCGYIPQCEHCSVGLTYHSKNNRLMCHYCGFSQDMLQTCPSCGSKNIKDIGVGTQRAEAVLHEQFPQARIFRMDADTTVQRVSHEKILDDFAKNGDILIGTQMVAKGLDFDNVTLVGVLDSDIALYSGDFRAATRTFSLISQVIGRAGRRQTLGRAVIQTYSPTHPVIVSASTQDYKGFYDYEIRSREMLQLPPFSDLFLLTLWGDDDLSTLKAALRLSATIHKAFEGVYKQIKSEVLGPVAPTLFKINDKYRYHISFRNKDCKQVRAFISSLMIAFSQGSKGKITLSAEINPLNY